METFSALLALCAGNSPVNSPHKGQWRGALMFSLICAWINDWVNNREAGYLRRHRGHYDVKVMRGKDCISEMIRNWDVAMSAYSILPIWGHHLGKWPFCNDHEWPGKRNAQILKEHKSNVKLFWRILWGACKATHYTCPTIDTRRRESLKMADLHQSTIIPALN